MRLTQYEINSIKKAFKDIFESGDIYLLLDNETIASKIGLSIERIEKLRIE